MIRIIKVNKCPKKIIQLYTGSRDVFALVLWGKLEQYRFAWGPVEGKPLPAMVSKTLGFLRWYKVDTSTAYKNRFLRKTWLLIWVSDKNEQTPGLWYESDGVIGEQETVTKDKIIKLEHRGLCARYRKL